MLKIANLICGIPLFAVFDIKLNPNVIPSFIFHKVLPDDFGTILLYLKDNHYRSLGINEYYSYLTGKITDNDKKVIITFDDGLRNTWSVVFPLLKKFDMKAVFYVNPANLLEKVGLGLNLTDVWEKRVSLQELNSIEKEKPFISWDEAREMESSGLVNIESHGWRHQICFVDDKIIDFQHPNKQGIPEYPWLFSAIDAKREDMFWGTPVYVFEPRLVARRYFDDVHLRNYCINYVKDKGGLSFFCHKNWRADLQNLVKKYKKNNLLNTQFENEIEQELAIKDSLERAKEKIEQELNKTCEHFAYPWSMSGDLGMLWLKELGFKTVFRFMKPYQLPAKGSNPYNLSRIEGYWIKSLPGKKRISIWSKLRNRIKI